ncbi:MAG: SUMF1/EgtB/PvdO family nonheme iron enzyme [Kiritimatiellae bacterium]|nr:SUMF1/EgtB/PvdO family nonheme iron enzyme [Kiritimatiellia bacterium]
MNRNKYAKSRQSQNGGLTLPSRTDAMLPFGGFRIGRIIGFGFFVCAISCAVAETMPPPGFCAVPANPQFRFVHGLTDLNGEASPISNAYYLAEFPVTCAEYARYVVSVSNETVRVPNFWKEREFPPEKANHPVTGVSRLDAERYCQWLGRQQTNWNFRLPTEAEWEWAASGPNRRSYPWGNAAEVTFQPRTGKLMTKMNYQAVAALAALTNSVATNALYVSISSETFGTRVDVTNLLSISTRGVVIGWHDPQKRTGYILTDLFKKMLQSGGFTTPVDAYPKNISPFGCRDMAGNCWEWTSSIIPAQTGLKKGVKASAIRGGSWFSDKKSCEVVFRGEARQGGGAYATVGFRVLAEPKKDGKGTP